MPYYGTTLYHNMVLLRQDLLGSAFGTDGHSSGVMKSAAAGSDRLVVSSGNTRHQVRTGHPRNCSSTHKWNDSEVNENVSSVRRLIDGVPVADPAVRRGRV